MVGRDTAAFIGMRQVIWLGPMVTALPGREPLADWTDSLYKYAIILMFA
jgi:hypothetical protein